MLIVSCFPHYVNTQQVCLCSELHNGEGHALCWIRFEGPTVLVYLFELYLAQGNNYCLSLLAQEILQLWSESCNDNINFQLHNKSLSNAKWSDVWNSENYVKEHWTTRSKCYLQFIPLLRTSKWYHCWLRSTNTTIKLGNACLKLHDQDSNWVPSECRSATQQLLHLMCRFQRPCEHQCGSV